MSETRDVRGLQRKAAADVPLPPRRWRTRVLLPATLVVAVLVLVAIAAWESIAPATSVRAEPVIVKAVVGDAPGAVTVQAPGWLEPDPHPVYVPALTAGVVAEVLVLEGQPVEADQVVVRLIDDDATLERERTAAALEERRGEVAAAEADVEAARTALDNVVDRIEAVERARAELEAIRAERARLDAEIASADAEAGATADELQRKSKLVSSKAVATGEVERLRLRLDAERAAAAAKRAGIPVLEARLESAAARERAAARHAELLIQERRALGLAEARLATARAAERRAVAMLGEADLRLARTAVRTPVSGIVLRRLVSPGSTLMPTSNEYSSHVLHLYDPERLQVRVDVPLADAARVGLGQAAEIVVDALPDRVFAGTVSRVVHVADVAKNTVEVKVAVRDPVDVLKPEMLARVRFLADLGPREESGGRQRVFAPRQAVQRSADGARVLVVAGLSGGRGIAEARTVSVGSIVLEDHVEITSGLRPGDLVIVGAPPELAVGDRVAVEGADAWR